MKVLIVLSLMAAAAAVATPKRYPVLSTVWPPPVHRPYFPASYSPPATSYEATSSYATVPTSSYLSSYARSPARSSSNFSFLPKRRPVPSFALAKTEEKHETSYAPSKSYTPSKSYAPSHSYGYAPVKETHDFDYSVNEGGNSFGHQQKNDGYTTKGSYYIDLPDGRRQKVTYYVSGDSGFVAEVTYEGVAHYPAQKPTYYPAPKPTYHAHAPAHVTTPKPTQYPVAPGYLVSSAHIPSPFHG